MTALLSSASFESCINTRTQRHLLVIACVPVRVQTSQATKDGSNNRKWILPQVLHIFSDPKIITVFNKMRAVELLGKAFF